MRSGHSPNGLHASPEASDAGASRHGRRRLRIVTPPLLQQPGAAGQAGSRSRLRAVPARTARRQTRGDRESRHDQGANRQGSKVDEQKPPLW